VQVRAHGLARAAEGFGDRGVESERAVGFEPRELGDGLGFGVHVGRPQVTQQVARAFGLIVAVELLERARLLSVAEWTRARDLGPALFAGLAQPSTNRTISEQDGYADALRERGVAARKSLQKVHKEIATLIGGAEAERSTRLTLLREANTRLAPLAKTSDSHTALAELLQLWPDDASDDHRSVVRDAAAYVDAVETLHRGAVDTLRAVREGHALLGEAQEHVANLVALLRDDGERLSQDRIAKWNTEASALIQRIVAKPVTSRPPPPPTPPKPPATPRAPASTPRPPTPRPKRSRPCPTRPSSTAPAPWRRRCPS